MLNIFLWILAIIAILVLVLRFYVVPSQSQLPKNVTAPSLEQANHTLSPCPDKPNCVNSTATNSSHKIEPIKFTGSAEDALSKLATITQSMPKSQIHTQQKNYLHVIFKSPIMAYIDDTEFVLDEASGLIQVRSAARLGHSDLGKNRARIENIRTAFEGS